MPHLFDGSVQAESVEEVNGKERTGPRTLEPWQLCSSAGQLSVL